jgi:hypothetical protein
LHPDKARQRFIATYDSAPPVKKTNKGDKPAVHVHKNKKPSQKEINAFGKEASARFARLGIVTNILSASATITSSVTASLNGVVLATTTRDSVLVSALS